MTEKTQKITLENFPLKCGYGSSSYEFYDDGSIKAYACNVPDQLFFERAIEDTCNNYNEILAKEEQGSIDVVGDLKKKKQLAKNSYFYNKYCSHPKESAQKKTL